jgi:hypothetical protein
MLQSFAAAVLTGMHLLTFSRLCACLQRSHVKEMVQVFALMNMPDRILSALRLPQRQSCQQMVHGVFAHEHH